MSKLTPVVLLVLALFVCSPVFAIDGQILINQATVNAAGGFPYKITQAGAEVQEKEPPVGLPVRCSPSFRTFRSVNLRHT